MKHQEPVASAEDSALELSRGINIALERRDAEKLKRLTERRSAIIRDILRAERTERTPQDLPSDLVEETRTWLATAHRIRDELHAKLQALHRQRNTVHHLAKAYDGPASSGNHIACSG